MEYENFKTLALNRQSCRDFNGEDVEIEKLQKAVDIALLAPSACNSQPWKIYCVTSPKKREMVLDAVTEKNRNLFLKKATAFMVIAEREAKIMKDVEQRFHSGFFVKYDVGELIAYLTLALKEQGLESCIIGWVNADKLKEMLSLGEKEGAHLVVAVGKSSIPLRQKTRKPKEEVVEFI